MFNSSSTIICLVLVIVSTIQIEICHILYNTHTPRSTDACWIDSSTHMWLIKVPSAKEERGNKSNHKICCPSDTFRLLLSCLSSLTVRYSHIMGLNGAQGVSLSTLYSPLHTDRMTQSCEPVTVMKGVTSSVTPSRPEGQRISSTHDSDQKSICASSNYIHQLKNPHCIKFLRILLLL